VNAPSDLLISLPLVSLIIPCRNEAANLPQLLRSMEGLSWRPLELILVDDHSEDSTFDVLTRFAELNREKAGLTVRVLKTPLKPSGWAGKNWACHHGALQAKGEYYIFSDADTWHSADSIERVVRSPDLFRNDMISVAPFHQTPTAWEKIMGPFYLFTFVAGNAFRKARAGRYYSIGQYLVFSRLWYKSKVNHELVQNFICDDMEMAKRTFALGGRFSMWVPEQPVYTVRMYSNFRDFFQGWRRNFRLGFGYSNIFAFFDIYCLFAVLSLSFRPFAIWGLSTAVIWILSLLIVHRASLRWGQFPVWSILFLPMSLLVFVSISLISTFDHIFGRSYRWRGRDYESAKIC
jgi:glycosyltransferase involved in cell wall biosynthesis